MKKCTKCKCLLDYRKIEKDFFIIGDRGGRHKCCYKCFYKELNYHCKTQIKYLILIMMVCVSLFFFIINYYIQNFNTIYLQKFDNSALINSFWYLLIVIFIFIITLLFFIIKRFKIKVFVLIMMIVGFLLSIIINNLIRNFFVIYQRVNWNMSLVNFGYALLVISISIIISLFFIIKKIRQLKHNTKMLLYYDQLNISASYQDFVGIEQIDRVHFMSGEEFEVFCGNLFIKLGYNVTYTSSSNDYGVDILIEKENHNVAIQTKRYKKPVGVKAIQEIYAGMQYYKIENGLVITSAAYYTNQAVNLAKSCNIELWTLNDLMYNIKKIG